VGGGERERERERERMSILYLHTQQQQQQKTEKIVKIEKGEGAYKNTGANQMITSRSNVCVREGRGREGVERMT